MLPGIFFIGQLKASACIILVLFVLCSCSDEFLNRPAQGCLDSSTIANQYGVEANLISAYSMLDGWGNYGNWGGAASNWMFGSVASDDAYTGSEPGGIHGDTEIYWWQSDLTDAYLNSKWEVNYDGVNRANATLTLLKSAKEISIEDCQRIEGEALFLRAHYHFEIWRMWENIPYYREDDSDYRKSNLGTDALTLMLEDLESAIQLLPESQDAPGRVTKWTAKALKGRILAYYKAWEDVLITLGDVVENGPYALEENFHYVFDVAHNNGPETILAYQASVDDGNPTGENGNRNDRLNFPHSGSPFGCCGFHQPSQNLVNVFKVDEQGLPYLDGSWNKKELTKEDRVDPRLDWTVGRDSVPYLDWGIHEPDWIRDRVWSGPFSPKKNVYEQSSAAASSVGWANYQLHSMNLHLLRYADVLLLLAEAEILAGSIENARQLINQVRERAGNGVQGPDGGQVVVSIEDPAVIWANYRIGLYPPEGWDADIALKALKMERRLELAMEGHRLFDLRRWKDDITVLNSYLEVEKTRRFYLVAALPYEEKHTRYPLPRRQIELSRVNEEDRLIQNPGW